MVSSLQTVPGSTKTGLCTEPTEEPPSFLSLLHRTVTWAPPSSASVASWDLPCVTPAARSDSPVLASSPARGDSWHSPEAFTPFTRDTVASAAGRREDIKENDVRRRVNGKYGVEAGSSHENFLSRSVIRLGGSLLDVTRCCTVRCRSNTSALDGDTRRDLLDATQRCDKWTLVRRKPAASCCSSPPDSNAPFLPLPGPRPHVPPGRELASTG